jgi:hypothetical protein
VKSTILDVETGLSWGSIGIPENLFNPVIFLYETMQRNMWLGMIPPILSVSGKLLKEKEMRIREGMRQMGLLDSAFYLAMFLTNLVETGMFAGCSTFCLAVLTPNFFVASNVFIIFLNFWFISLGTYVMATLLTLFFTSS